MERREENMNSRKLLKQCLNCKNNIACWHLDESRPGGREASGLKIKPTSLIRFIWKYGRGSLKEFEYSCIRLCIEGINPATKPNDLSHIYTQRVMAVLEAHACSQDDWWCCPGDDPESNESFVYEERQREE